MPPALQSPSGVVGRCLAKTISPFRVNDLRLLDQLPDSPGEVVWASMGDSYSPLSLNACRLVPRAQISTAPVR